MRSNSAHTKNTNETLHLARSTNIRQWVAVYIPQNLAKSILKTLNGFHSLSFGNYYQVIEKEWHTFSVRRSSKPIKTALN